MAKVPFTKLKLKTDDSVKHIQINDEITIEVRQYLPIQEKLKLIGDVVMQAHEQDANYSNPVKAEVFRDLEIVFAYTNLSFTDKQKEDLPKLYDMLKSSGLLDKIIETIPEAEYNDIYGGVQQSIESIYKYQNSVLGILDSIQNDYSNLDLDIEGLIEKIKDPESLKTLKEIAPMLVLDEE